MLLAIPSAGLVFCALVQASGAIETTVGEPKPLPYKELGAQYRDADRRIFFFDSTDTLRDREWTPNDMARVHKVLGDLTQDEKNEVWIASGRPIEHLKSYYGTVPRIRLAGETASVMPAAGLTGVVVSTTDASLIPVDDIAKHIQKVIEEHLLTHGLGLERIPDSQLVKHYNTLTFKYKKTPGMHEDYKMAELGKTLKACIEEKWQEWQLKVMPEPDNFRITFRPPSADKGHFVSYQLDRFIQEHHGKRLFGLSMGDHKPRDDGMHKATHKHSFHSVIVTSKTGIKTSAHHRVNNANQALDFLEELVKNQ